MIPRHCGDVGVQDVKFELTEQNLKKHFLGRKSYTRTMFYAVTNSDDWSVVQVSKKSTKALFQLIESVKIVSLPERTRFVNESELEVLDMGNLLTVQSRHPGKLVLIKGRFEHISFVDVKLPARIKIVDIVPPRPSKLEFLIRSLVKANPSLLDLCVELVDIAELANDERGGVLVLPCRASYEGMDEEPGSRERFYLDQAPELTEKQVKSAVLIGCPLSARIFEELYGSKPRLSNICARETVEMMEDSPPTIARCCKVKEGVEVDGRMIVVPWGANICEVAEALRIALSL